MINKTHPSTRVLQEYINPFLGPNIMNLSYIAELSIAGSNLNYRFFRLNLQEGFEWVIQIWTGGRQFSGPANS